MADKTLDKHNEQLDDTPWGHKWGFKDTRFILQPDRSVTVTGSRYAISGTEMPDFIPFVEEMLGVTIDPQDLKPEVSNKPVAPPIMNDNFYRALQTSFPDSQYSQDSSDRLLHSHGQTTVDEVYQVLYNQIERVADLVFYPESDEDVVKLIELATEHDVCLVPFGGGTSVSCALKLPNDETRMIVVVDMRRMNKILWLDRENYRASVQAGITGKQLEEELEKLGFTSGHEPDSLELSTLGGWIATNASGMKKNRYGNIEDMVENFSLITPKGVIEQKVTMPRISIGMQPNKFLFGNEGNLGIITKAEIRIHKLPEAKKYGSIVFPTFEKGTAFLYELTRSGSLPASVRLVDNFQFRFGSALRPRPTAAGALLHKLQKFFLLKVKGFDPHRMCAATLVMEGSHSEVAYQEKLVYRLAKKHDGIAGGEGNGKRGYMLTYAIAYIRDFMADYYVTGETYETTVPWDKIHDVINAVDRAAREQHEAHGLPGKPYVSPRITQLYHTGVCIYFTHGFSAKGVNNPDRIFSEIEHSLRETILANGGSVSHHHGIGKLRRDFMPETLSETSIEMLREVKQAHDPQNIFGIGNNVFAE
jgi:alkyldihydroxyacetonephosphate synthase